METMTWMLLDGTGNAIDTYDDEVAAHAALRALVEAEPAARDEVVLLAYDGEGMPVGDAITFEDLGISTVNLISIELSIPVFMQRGTYGLGGVARIADDVAARVSHVGSIAGVPV